MRVQQDDFIGFRAVDLAGMAQAQQVFRMLAPPLVAYAGLAHHERLKPFFAQLGQDRGRGDVAVPLGTALMRGVREDGRGHAPDLVIRQGVVGTQCGGMVGETGCEHVFLLTWLLKKHRIPRFGAQPFGCSVRSARRTRLASLPPSFLSSSPATVRSARPRAVKETSARLVRPAGSAEDTAWRALTAHGRGLQSRTR